MIFQTPVTLPIRIVLMIAKDSISDFYIHMATKFPNQYKIVCPD